MCILHFIAWYFHATLFASETSEYVARFQLPNSTPNELIDTVQHKDLAGLWYITKRDSEFCWSIPRYFRLFPSMMLLFMLGGYMAGSNFFKQKARNKKYLLSFLIIGMVGSYLMFYIWYAFNILGNLFIALSNISLIAILQKSSKGCKLLKPLAPLGRMALTNYIMQSIIGIAIFYGVGLGYFTKPLLYRVYIIGVTILIFQIKFSKHWLKRYNFGPIKLL